VICENLTNKNKVNLESNTPIKLKNYIRETFDLKKAD
jgi:hypothetical protein